MRRLAALSLILVLTLSTSATAHQQAKHDSNDSRSKLDMGRAVFDHDDDYLYLTLKTREKWRPRNLKKEGNWIAFSLGYKKHSFFVVVDHHKNDPKLRATIMKPESAKKLGRARVKILDKKSIKVRVNRSKVKAHGAWIKWKVLTQWFGNRKCRRGCFDAMPGTYLKGIFKHSF
jgi:hypothetical protein